MKGTKLWQQAGSPIIQGRSRRQRPSWQQWLPAWIVVSAVVVVAVAYVPELSAGSRWAVLSGMLGGLIGTLVGVQVTRSMGWRFPFAWGALLGLAGAAVLVAVGASVLPA